MRLEFAGGKLSRDDAPRRPHPRIEAVFCRQRVAIREEHKMSYYFSKILPIGFEDAVQRATEALKREGFGILTEIDVKKTLKAKIGVEFRDYRILGACNPKLAYEALQLEDKIGTMLPCNVVVQAIDPGRTEIVAIDPVASMQAIDNPRLKQAAEQVQTLLKKVIAAL
jgi:uncharacterized protein (DUF302 family)